jgi:hypothetical protein
MIGFLSLVHSSQFFKIILYLEKYVRTDILIHIPYLVVSVAHSLHNFSTFFFIKIGQNSTADMFGRYTFYSALFYLCGRTIGQLATLLLLTSIMFPAAAVIRDVNGVPA